jgi:hypothetical protein
MKKISYREFGITIPRFIVGPRRKNVPERAFQREERRRENTRKYQEQVEKWLRRNR